MQKTIGIDVLKTPGVCGILVSVHLKKLQKKPSQ